ncbi:MAG: triose-phosphate isomerase [Candidatus Woesearchaeota archaeon]|jgi:triosephosphate isomerase
MIIANWKMNMTAASTRLFLEKFNPQKECIICAPYTILPLLHNQNNPNIKIGAQNLFYEPNGAYTGEISPAMIKEYAEYVIIGHNERRKIFNETDEIIHKKLRAAQTYKLIPILCINYINQLNSLNTLTFDILYIAYEPIESIGTGNATDPNIINTILKKIRTITEKNAKRLFLLYGGSITSTNAKSYLQQPEINGLLVGNTSLNPEEFEKIILEQ